MHVMKQEDISDAITLLDIINKPRQLDRYKTSLPKDGEVRLTSFKWSNCGSSSDPLSIQSFSLMPDPIRLPGNLTVAVSGGSGTELMSPLKLELEIKKKVVFVWIAVPCVDDLGSCTYDDICKLDPFDPDNCPPPFSTYGLPCTCPIDPGYFDIDATTFYVSQSLPGGLASGDYQIKATLSSNGSAIGC